MGYYRNFEIETVENAPISPDATGEEKNLLLGLPIYGLTENGILEETMQTEYFNTPDSSDLLTDGKFAEKPYYLDPAYFHITRGVGRTFIFRLPYLSAACRASRGRRGRTPSAQNRSFALA